MGSESKLVLALGLALLAGCTEKPVLELQQVEEAFAQALDAEADIYAPDEYDFALMNLESGEIAIKEQEATPPWRRDYGPALDLLELAYEQAGQAAALAIANRDRVFQQAQTALPEAERLFQTALETVEEARRGPITRRDLQTFDDELTGTFATLTRARETFDAGNYRDAFILLQEVQERSVALESRAGQIAELRDPPG